MKKSDRDLGMDCDITRRDFLHDSSLLALGLGILGPAVSPASVKTKSTYYPPTRTGMRGSHKGSFETAHTLVQQGSGWESAEETGEEYDLVVVGGGISGLASAWYYRKLHGPESRILIIENHDDFGGHAKRNEFHQGGQMRLAWGGVFNLEYSEFNDTVNALLEELGVNIKTLLANNDFQYGSQGTAGPAIFFDRETYGQDKLVIDCSLRGSDLDKMADKVNEFPLSKKSRSSLEAFCRARRDVTDGMSPAEKGHLMHGISYIDFLRKFGGLTEEAAEIFVKTTDGFWGVQAHSLSVTECTYIGLPINHLLGEMPEPNYEIQDGSAMFPDGNASIARLLVRGLIPGVAAGTGADNIVSAVFDYERLDEQASPVRLRLNSTVVSAKNNDQGQVETRYVRDGNAYNVRSRHCVLACYHVMIPHICPEMPEAQKEAQRYQVKRPLLLTNVLLRNSKAADKLGISGAYCPGRIHGATWLVKGVHAPDYRHEWDDDGSVVMMFWGMPETKRELDLKAQFHESRSRMVQLTFEDFEREVRTVLDRILGPGGFDVKRDILAITVNRWPHGYAHDYLDLWDPDFPEGEAPNEIARKAFGNIAIANSDAGADAYTHVAIDEAWRAVNELSDAGAN